MIAWSDHGTDSKFAFANRTNAITHAFAPNAESATALLNSLGLPSRCEALVGISWYVTYGHDVRSTCPELGEVSASKWLMRTVGDPEMLSKTAYKSLLFIGNPIQLHLLPEVVEVSNVARLARHSIFDLFITATAFPIRIGMFAALLALAGLATTVTGSSRLRAVLLALFAACAAIFFIALIGDGFSEFSRHIHLAYSLGFVGAIVASMVVWENKVTRKALLLCASAFVVGALGSNTQPTAHITPLRIEDRPGLLVISSQTPRLISVSTIDPALNTGESTQVLQPVDPKIAHVLGLRTDMLHWVVAPTIRATPNCTPVFTTVFFNQSRTLKFETCVKNF